MVSGRSVSLFDRSGLRSLADGEADVVAKSLEFAEIAELFLPAMALICQCRTEGNPCRM